MARDVIDLYVERASLAANDRRDELRRVLDPNDHVGINNSYIDAYLKHYLLRYLEPDKQDRVLEVGCGIGRLTEFVAPFVRSIHGVDVVDEFVEQCRARPDKHPNAEYLEARHLVKIAELDINKIFIVWVLLHLDDDDELVTVLREYAIQWPGHQRIVILDQVKATAQTELLNDRFYCRYRTLEGLRILFQKAGYRVQHVAILGERKYGPMIRLLVRSHWLYNKLPRSLSRIAGLMFRIDKALMDTNIIHRRIEDRPVDVVFVLAPLPE